jgi:hypothetical protein
MVVTEGCLDYSVSDGFGYDLLGLHVWLEAEFSSDVAEKNFAVANVDFLQPKLDYCMF